ncbi:hypothetical protein SLS63_007660 [Diaporthe eres]|uniref:Major facilitator superfamily transporter n=1 Tax=Diaporthe eres TaxID=83184 RepID=A0ABR1P4Y4_DIAER
MSPIYSTLKTDHGDDEPFLAEDAHRKLPLRAQERHRKLPQWISILKDLSLIVLAGSAIFMTNRHAFVSNEPGPCDCGDSVAEAKSLGCQYDSIAAAWLPPHCMDKDLVAEFDKDGDGPDGRWQYWADANHTMELSLEEVGALADTPGKLFWTTPRWHFMHCFYYWRKLQRSQTTGVKIEARYDNERHVTHCGKMFMNPGMEAFSYVELKSSNTEPPEFAKHLVFPVIDLDAGGDME